MRIGNISTLVSYRPPLPVPTNMTLHVGVRAASCSANQSPCTFYVNDHMFHVSNYKERNLKLIDPCSNLCNPRNWDCMRSVILTLTNQVAVF